MVTSLIVVCIAGVFAAVMVKRARDRRELERYTITAEKLHARLLSDRNVLVVDVRQPLDLLGDSVIIPGAKWFAPQALLDDPSLIPWGKDVVVYCTCPTDKTSNAVLQRALAMGFSRIQMLKGGLEAWRENGFPVEPYEKPFHLDSGQDFRIPVAS